MLGKVLRAEGDHTWQNQAHFYNQVNSAVGILSELALGGEEKG